MGCWNQTCAISNLPINCGEEVIGIFITDETGSDTDGRRYHIPILISVEGEYNDYGLIENESGDGLPHLMKVFAKRCDKYDKGDRHRESALDPATMTFEDVMEATREERLSFHASPFTGKSTKHQINHIQIRKRIFDEIIENFTIRAYKEGGKYSDRAAFTDIMDDYHAFYALLTDDAHHKASLFHDRAFENRTNYISMLFNEGYERSTQLFSAKNYIRHLVNKKGISYEDLKPLIEVMVKVKIIDVFMDETHRPWVMPGYAGQDGTTEYHTMLAAITIEEAELMSRRWDEDEDEDE